MTFTLDSRLAADTFPVIDLKLCRALLMNDARFPWLILVPMRAGLRDFHDVPWSDKGDFLAEIDCASAVLKAQFDAQKMNVGALGNMVPQLHVHVIARFEGDAAWPKPVWGHGEAVPYEPSKAVMLVEKLKTGLQS